MEGVSWGGLGTFAFRCRAAFARGWPQYVLPAGCAKRGFRVHRRRTHASVWHGDGDGLSAGVGYSPHQPIAKVNLIDPQTPLRKLLGGNYYGHGVARISTRKDN